MERLNEIMGRTMPQRPSNPTQQPDPYQGHYPISQNPQTEPGLQPLARQRFPEQAPQSLPPNMPAHPDATYPYGNGTQPRPNQQQYTNNMYNQRQAYVQEGPQNHFNGPANYNTRTYAEQNEPEAQGITHNNYHHSRSTIYPATSRTNETNDSNRRYNDFYSQNTQYSPQHHQNQPNYQSQPEQYFYRADVNSYRNQPGGDAMNSEDMEDDEEMGMRNGDWEVDHYQRPPYRPSNIDSRAQTRKLQSLYEATPAYIEQQPIQPNRLPHNPYDTQNGARDNTRQPSAYAIEQPMHKPRSMQPAQNYPSQHIAPPAPSQPTNYTSHTSQGTPMQPARQGRSQQPPHPTTYEQEARYRQRTTQPLNPQDLSRQRELASQLIQAHMRPVESSQPVTKPERREIQTTPRHQPAQPARQTSQVQIVQPPPSTFMPSKPVCARCKGAGYLRANVPFGHPNFGKPIACACKEAERKEKRRQQLREMSNLDAFRQKTFNTFNPQIPGVREAYEAAKQFAQDPNGWLKFIGPNGCGKTHLAAAIANQALNNGSVVLFETVPDLLAHLRAAFAPTATEVYDQLFSKMREAELLILDDLGTQQSSPWANEQIFQLINYRYNMGMPTVITGNPKGIQSIDERIRSRLSDAGLVTSIIMDRAQDYRPNNPHRYS